MTDPENTRKIYESEARPCAFPCIGRDRFRAVGQGVRRDHDPRGRGNHGRVQAVGMLDSYIQQRRPSITVSANRSTVNRRVGGSRGAIDSRTGRCCQSRSDGLLHSGVFHLETASSSKQALLAEILACEFRIQDPDKGSRVSCTRQAISVGVSQHSHGPRVVSIPELGFERKHDDGQLSVVFIQHTLEIQEIIFVIEPRSVLPCYMEVHGVVPSESAL